MSADQSRPRKNAPKTRGRPFEAGNPGKPRGARHKATLAVEALLEGEAEALTRKAIERALAGDSVALRLCLDRLAPPRKGRPVTFALPSIASADDVSAALGAVLQAVSEGELTPEEGQAVAALLETKRRAIETVEIEQRLEALEDQAERSNR